MIRRLLATSALVLACVSAAGTAAADTSGSGGIATGPGGGTLTVGLTVSIAGTPGVPASSGHAPRPYRTVAVPSYDPTSPLAGLCPSPSGFNGFGWMFVVTVFDTATGAVVSIGPQCVPLPGPVGTGFGPGPPQPPTIGEIWAATTIPLPTLGISPADEGVTGLDTWMWSQSPSTIAINATIDGWTVTGTATRHRYLFDVGDGTLHDTLDGGIPSAPAVVYRYDSKGVRTIRVGSVWDAVVSMTGPGLPPRATDIGSATLTVAANYPVVEVRSSLVG